MKLARFQPLLLTIFGISLCVSLLVLGWHKLPYGFNFSDEGMYMTDGWRLTVGDRLFPDSAMNASILYAVFNSLVFKIYPAITLLEFRHLQYVFAIIAIALLGAAAYRWTRNALPILLALSVFLFTGLDVLGNDSILSYYTYPHLFLTIHIAFLILATQSENNILRTSCFLLSGSALWAIGFSLLPLSATMASPLLLWLIFKYLGIPKRISFKEIILLLIPGILLWLVFIFLHNREFLQAIIDTYGYIKEGRSTREMTSRWLALQYLMVAAIFLVLFLGVCRDGTKIWAGLGAAKFFNAEQFGIANNQLLEVPITIFSAAALSTLMFLIIGSNLSGLLAPYFAPSYSPQMFLGTLLIAFVAFFSGHLFREKLKGKSINELDCLLLLIIVPSLLFVILFSSSSSMGALAVCYGAIPLALAMTLFIARQIDIRYPENSYISAVAAISFLFPYYYFVAWADWKNTFYDLPPEKLTITIPSGFGAGIKTNTHYTDLARWIETTAFKYSSEGDLAIVTEYFPMVYMLAKLRPSLNHSWTGFARSDTLRRDAIKKMLQNNRQPKIAFRFLAAPMIFPITIPGRDQPIYSLGVHIQFPQDDAINRYIIDEMLLVDTYKFNGRKLVEFYVRPDSGHSAIAARRIRDITPAHSFS